MDQRVLILENLKVSFGLLFLKTHPLPTLLEVMTVINNAHVVIAATPLHLALGMWNSFRLALEMLNSLIADLLLRGGDLKLFVYNNFLGEFIDKRDSKTNVIPFDKDRGGIEFFESFFQEQFTPKTQEELDELLEWCLFSVQHSDSDATRLNEALELLCGVRVHILKKFEGSPPTKVKSDNDDDDDNVFTAPPLSDTKSCSCYTYEVTGDCSCIYDDVFSSV